MKLRVEEETRPAVMRRCRLGEKCGRLANLRRRLERGLRFNAGAQELHSTWHLTTHTEGFFCVERVISKDPGRIHLNFLRIHGKNEV
jgi:hypothetical protein